jgi:hypothetical protein
MFKRVSSLAVALAAFALIVGCSEAPQTQMKASQDAMQQAQLAEAVQYAPATFQVAQDTMNAAQVEMQKQDSKFALFRRYGKSAELFTAAQRLAEKATADAQTAKEQVRKEDSALVVQIDALMVTAKDAYAAAPKGKGTRADLELIKTDLTSTEQAYVAAVAEYTNGSYLTAKTKLEAVVSQLNRIIGEIDAAKAKLSPKK